MLWDEMKLRWVMPGDPYEKEHELTLPVDPTLFAYVIDHADWWQVLDDSGDVVEDDTTYEDQFKMCKEGYSVGSAMIYNALTEISRKADKDTRSIIYDYCTEWWHCGNSRGHDSYGDPLSIFTLRQALTFIMCAKSVFYPTWGKTYKEIMEEGFFYLKDEAEDLVYCYDDFLKEYTDDLCIGFRKKTFDEVAFENDMTEDELWEKLCEHYVEDRRGYPYCEEIWVLRGEEYVIRDCDLWNSSLTDYLDKDCEPDYWWGEFLNKKGQM